MEWQDHQKWEAEWHGNCVNSFWEETKQIVYANRMGLIPQMIAGKYPVYDMQGKSVLDVGGGPYSLLLKCINVKGSVIDPAKYPPWTLARYRAADIWHVRGPAEEMKEYKFMVPAPFDEVWCYNVLQHTISPAKIIKNMYDVAKVVRIFEWIETPPTVGHPHTLHAKDLDLWLKGTGKTEDINEHGCVGKCYYGVFTGAHYA
jgi:2-polyprenyl-3-methyl-5-hydroxy-6-metoxy-1,4-benzoquinol methylase